MPVSIDNALRILRRRGWKVISNSEGAWVIQSAALNHSELTEIAGALRSGAVIAPTATESPAAPELRP